MVRKGSGVRVPHWASVLCSRLANKHRLGMTRQAISQHLELLENAGLVNSRREGRYKFHHLQTGPLETLTDRWLEHGRTEDE
jgi:DNA-binding transcriptional ArsR family regulator